MRILRLTLILAFVALALPWAGSAAPTITELGGFTANRGPRGIAAGPDGNLWLTQFKGSSAIVRVTPAGTVTEFTSGLPSMDPVGIAAGSDGNMWVALQKDPGGIARITPAGVITVFQTGLTPNSRPTEITAGPGGDMWFTALANPGRIGRITPDGTITEFTTGLLNDKDPTGITAGPDGNLWFTQQRDPGAIGRITPSGVVTIFQAGMTANAQPTGITSGPDGAIWFTESADPGRVGRITVGPAISGTSTAAVGYGTATVGATIAPNAEATTYRVEWGLTGAYGQQTAGAAALAAGGAQARTVELTGLAPETTYHYRVTATNATATATGPDMTFTTAAVPPAPYVPPAPAPFVPGTPFTPTPKSAIGVRVDAAPAAGTVRVRVPGSSGFTELDGSEALPVGSVIDTRQGRVSLTSALPGGGTQTAVFWDGVFTVRQDRVGSGQTRLVMPRATGCPAAAPRRASEDARRRAPRRPSLWGRDDKGRYRTDGSNSVATVRGTLWQTVERCDGTLTRVREGVVLVRDLRLKRTVRLTAGRSYLALARG